MSDNRLYPDRTNVRVPKVLLALLLPMLLIAFLLCGLSQGIQARSARLAGVNLVPNSGFETLIPDSWRCEGASPPTCGCDWSSESYSGSHSARVWGTANLCAVRWWSSLPTVSVGSRYVFSGWIQAANLSDKAFLTLAFYSSPCTGDPIAVYTSSIVTGSSGWTEVLGGGVAPQSAQCARIRCEFTRRGTAWFDEIYAGLDEIPTLTISKSDTPDPVKPGQNLVYTITYGNIGHVAATDVVITETYDKNVNFRGADPTPVSDSGNRVWRVDPLGPGADGSVVVTVQVTTTAVGVLTNCVEIGCKQRGPISTCTTTTVHPPSTMTYLPLILKDFRVLYNGGFETGDFTCWAHGGELDQSVRCGTAYVYEGNCVALLGNPDYPCGNGVPKGTAWVSQTFSVPSCPKPVLSFEYRIFSNDKWKPSSEEWDSFDVYVNNTLILSEGNKLWDKADCYRAPWDSTWRSVSYSLSAYKGQNIQVSFHNVNRKDRYYNTWTYVDQVAVTCEP